MVDLTTRYLGLTLANPLVPSASPLSRDLDTARRLEDAGASALVMYSLFEEAIHAEQEQMLRFVHHSGIGHPEADSFMPPVKYAGEVDRYLEQLHALKSALGIPIIASLNGISQNGWVDYGRALASAGADAIELNVYYVAADIDESAAEVEGRYLSLVRELRQAVSIPITVKLSSQFSAVANFVAQLEKAGANGVAVFNRFYQPDIDLETLAITPRIHFSDSHESLLRVRWIAILYGRVNLSLAVTGGFHRWQDAAKALLAGADVVHLCSALLEHGPEHLRGVRQGLIEWMETHEYESVAQLCGSVSQRHVADPAHFERANYVAVLDSYTPSPGVRR